MNSVYNETKISELEALFDMDDKYLNNKFLNEVILVKSESFHHFYIKHNFEIKTDINISIYYQLILANALYSMEMYKACSVIIHLILFELRKLKGYFGGIHQNKKTQGYKELYVFFILFAAKLYMKTKDYFTAIKELNEICDYEQDYSNFLYNILAGVCLTKLKYSDLGAVFIDSGWNYIQHALDDDFKLKVATDESKILRTTNKNDISRILENFFVPIRMIICIINLMKNKAIEKFQEEMRVNANICYYCNSLENKKRFDDNYNDKKFFSCLKCNRAHYCSLKCMQKMKSKHDIICLKYSEKFNEVNDIANKYVK